MTDLRRSERPQTPTYERFATFEERMELLDILEPDPPKPNLYKHNGRWYVSSAPHEAGEGGHWLFSKARLHARQEWIDGGGCV